LVEHGAVQIFTNLPNQMLGSLVEDDDGTLWISFHNGEVYWIKDGKIVPLGAKENLARGPGGATLAKDVHGRIWISRGMSLAVFRRAIALRRHARRHLGHDTRRRSAVALERNLVGRVRRAAAHLGIAHVRHVRSQRQRVDRIEGTQTVSPARRTTGRLEQRR